ncbi:hypothetical protein [Cellulomonas marina]|uniref:Uncharacterized protein n=1 Tax=Cellulomonas marina TaxID=988821 RepID=A0A1I1APS0_9CELL|nr:hypothetical protein [Cellulomonas marina]GIG30170.1 hypothetical protein Cma02nite_27700 [Cellulomonas marina]SFB38468.1 hypothetical protein SAMN05421867_11947 [Cellulomonas marina]
MTSASTGPATGSTTGPAPAPVTNKAYGALVGIASLGILLQGLWAGLFMAAWGGGGQSADTWEFVHARGADVTLLVSVAALVLAVTKLKARRDLVVGTVVLVALLVLEYVLGSLMADAGAASLTAVHVPLAMLLMAVAVWLPLRHRPRPVR